MPSVAAFLVPGDSTLTVKVLDLKNDEGASITSASVQLLEIVDLTGTQIGVSELPITLAGDGAGNYIGSIPHDIGTTVAERNYTIRIQATEGQLVRTWRRRVSLE